MLSAMMPKRLTVLLLLLQCGLVSAQDRPTLFSSKKAIKLEYDLDFRFCFDNREFDPSDCKYEQSQTLNAVLLTPSIGLSVMQNRKVRHKLMVGIDMWKNFGEVPVYGGVPAEADMSLVNTKLFHEIQLYYDGAVSLADGARFEAVAGVFPQAYREGDYGQMFYSDSERFWDVNIDGLLHKYRKDRFFAELGCDWMGMYGVSRRERFEVFSAGSWQPVKFLSLGWAGSFYHYACSELADGVVDNHMLNPYIKFDAAQWTGMQELSLKAGGILCYQCDRFIQDPVKFPCGGQVDFAARRWNVGLVNSIYFGDNLAPYFGAPDSTGAPFGSLLYRGSPFYRSKLYDRIECFWEPRISDFVSLRLSAVFHLADSPMSYHGCQQRLVFVFDLDALRNPRRR